MWPRDDSSVGDTLEFSMVCQGLQKAKTRHRPKEGLSIHTDRGSECCRNCSKNP
jgi:hypothetical protein